MLAWVGFQPALCSLSDGSRPTAKDSSCNSAAALAPNKMHCHVAKVGTRLSLATQMGPWEHGFCLSLVPEPRFAAWQCVLFGAGAAAVLVLASEAAERLHSPGRGTNLDSSQHPVFGLQPAEFARWSAPFKLNEYAPDRREHSRHTARTETRGRAICPTFHVLRISFAKLRTLCRAPAPQKRQRG
jgi:hypothetical protein